MTEVTEPKGTRFGMDAVAQQIFVRMFKGLPEKPSTTIRLFNRVDYYSAHGEDAIFVANEVFKTTSACKSIGVEPNQIDGVILNKARFESIIKELLLVKRYRVEVYINNGTNRNQDWTVEYKGSPGNLTQFEDILFANSDIAVRASIMAVKLGTEGKSKIVGVSVIDTVTTTIFLSEFPDDDSFSDLEALVVTNAPKECLLIEGGGSTEFQTLKRLMDRNDVLVTSRKKSDFSTDSLIQDLNSLLKFNKGQQENAQALPETSMEHAMSSTAALIKYLDLTSDASSIGQFSVKQLELSRYLKLDAAVIKALNIDPPPGTSSAVGGVATSILGLLDRCRTPQGHRLIAQWVRQPLKDLSLIKERHDIVEQLVKDSDLRSALSEDHLRRIPDLEQLSKKLTRKNAGLQDCYKVYMCMLHLPSLTNALTKADGCSAMDAMIIEPLKESINDMDKFQQMVEQTIDLEATDSGDYLVRASFDEELKELKQTMDKLKHKIENLLNKVADDLNMDAGKNIKLESTQQQGFYFRISLKDEPTLRNNKSYEVFESIKAGVKFRNDKLSELNEDYKIAREKYEKQQQSVVTEIMTIAAGYSNPIKAIASVVAILDVLTAFAVAAVHAQTTFVRPEMIASDAGVINIEQARHPCLETQPDVHFIANDAAFKRDESQFFIITGPNMGGKSTYMKSIGVCVFMAHIGSFVPCDKASISVIDCLLARVGADDSQTRGISTFMMEMVETATILRTATCNSFIIIDELGRGTSTYDGRGVAWSIAEYIAKEIKAYCLFATHFHEITRLADEVPTVRNYHVTALVEKDSVTFLYSVEPGICDQSFGIHVAKMVQFPEDIIKFAKAKQSELEDGENVEFEGYNSVEEKRKIKAEGELLIARFVEKCRTLDESLPEDDLKKQVELYKNEILEKKNPYIAALLTTA
ncbi:DNA mismatch repair protein Msh2 [Fopius arisanus]|uniref:DNA mismatch repair protein MSH2 n=1 Tax=Fopius arisanus TaxID=64838 RepID=A0A9R1T9F4_9HYME|nr:PREDICTED: DNA mismatch repair protein Msh2 [Fopius arisanus]